MTIKKSILLFYSVMILFPLEVSTGKQNKTTITGELAKLFNFVEISHNQPDLSSCATWYPDAVTLVNGSFKKFEPYTLFVDKNNTVFAIDSVNNYLYEWRNNSNSSSRTQIPDRGVDQSHFLFVSTTGDVYMAGTSSIVRSTVRKLIKETQSTQIIAKLCHLCEVIFISINDVLYCSISLLNQVVTIPLHSDTNTLTIAAGVGLEGREANMLNNPVGIFVNNNLDLYVIDCDNNRIQRFRSGESEGITVFSNIGS